MTIPMKPNSDPFAANIRKYFIYMALKGLGFGLFVATWVIYLQQRRGLSLSQAALIDATFFVSVAFGEVPTGIVADTLGRKTSIAIGAALMTTGVLAWVSVPTVPLIMLAYAAMGIGFTFTSGAEDALFYETLQRSGRGDDYTRLVGRAGATITGALALGSVLGGWLASIELILPYLMSSLALLTMLGVVLTFTESRSEEKSDGPARKTFREILRESIALMRARPTLRYPMFYLALVPLVSLMLESVFLQPQAVAMGVPLAGIGILVMMTQLTNMAGATWSDRVRAYLGEGRIFYLIPLILILSLLLLAAFQIFPALLLIIVMGFFTAVLRPLVLNRIQNEVSDDIRATVISMQSLMFAILGAISQPSLGFVADQAGLPAAYVVLAGSFGLLILLLFRASRGDFPQTAVPARTQVDFGA